MGQQTNKNETRTELTWAQVNKYLEFSIYFSKISVITPHKTLHEMYSLMWMDIQFIYLRKALS